MPYKFAPKKQNYFQMNLIRSDFPHFQLMAVWDNITYLCEAEVWLYYLINESVFGKN